MIGRRTRRRKGRVRPMLEGFELRREEIEGMWCNVAEL